MRQSLRPAFPAANGVDRQADAVGEQRHAAVAIQAQHEGPDPAGVLGHLPRPDIVPLGDAPGRLAVLDALREGRHRRRQKPHVGAACAAPAVEGPQHRRVNHHDEGGVGVFGKRVAQRQGAVRRQVHDEPI